ncbi:Bgt-1963 [Blumeria graminis f. sp. tritici]|uniref:Bgt-1963 n=2 Tax=Blumeria graminis f. sp. tritici TaxID=62690 RepID=A0A061HKA4_BLUGR|nr:hypothetical protein BGT96224_1963 [Blumeria graminis f. sp. tritici 96224]VDB90835.1 Bgt-1963 [Blumeria graminis f. sp. tritici]
METIHAPTLPSGSNSNTVQGDGIQTDGFTFAQLQAKKMDMEAKLQALGSVMDLHEVDMKTPLITQDGFPRADLDVALIRTTRAKIIHIQNDLKSLMSVIERHIHAYFASKGQDDVTEDSELKSDLKTTTSSPSHTNKHTLARCFAKVNSIVYNSPSAAAGLQIGDKISSFGHINFSNHDRLNQIKNLVQESEGVWAAKGYRQQIKTNKL